MVRKCKCQTKLKKFQAGYGENPAGFSCGVCMHFLRRMGECAIVEGNIKAAACCNFFDSSTFKPSLN